MDGPYQLVNAWHAHDGPVRSLSAGPNGEIVSGCQSDSPCVRRWRLGDIAEIGTPLYHDHWVTAVTSLPADSNREFYPRGCLVTGCMDQKIRVFDNEGSLQATLEGHTKGVISFSWTAEQRLLSGSWDGTAKVWDLQTGSCVQTLQPHENGVHVLGVGSQVATTSTGESVDGKPANFKLRLWSAAGALLGTVEDHLGSIRCICALPGIGGFATGANDGTVSLRSAEGEVLATVFHSQQEDGSPPFILDCCALSLEADTGRMDVVSAGEDGSVIVWAGTEALQAIPHPTSVWCVVAVPGGSPGDFITGGHDGVLRLFSRDAARINESSSAAQLTLDFLAEVAEAQQKKKRGPSSEELARAPKWEQRGQHPGASENQVMVFNQAGAMIAAQWNSGAWVVIGEVTGSGDGGYINEVWFDHVMPVEIEGPTGLRSLKLGHNNGENPFVAAQRFIDTYQLQQSYLGQIADWITARAGNQTPTIGADGGRRNETGATPVVTTRKAAFSFRATGYATFEDIPAATKLFAKVVELSAAAPAAQQLSEREAELVNATLATLCDTSHYHSSLIGAEQLKAVAKMATQWAPASSFPAFDILRLVAVHPAGSEALVKLTAANEASSALTAAAALLSSADLPHTCALTASRFLCNCFKTAGLRAALLRMGAGKQVLAVIAAQSRSANKSVRVAVATLALNLSAVAAAEGLPLLLRRTLVELCVALVGAEQESSDVVLRACSAMGTVLTLAVPADSAAILQGLDAAEVLKRVATEWGAAKLGDRAASCLREVLVLAEQK